MRQPDRIPILSGTLSETGIACYLRVKAGKSNRPRRVHTSQPFCSLPLLSVEGAYRYCKKRCHSCGQPAGSYIETIGSPVCSAAKRLHGNPAVHADIGKEAYMKVYFERISRDPDHQICSQVLQTTIIYRTERELNTIKICLILPCLQMIELRVRNIVSGLCGTDAFLSHNQHQLCPEPIPVSNRTYLGHENGVVVETGKAVTKFKVGDRVTYGSICQAAATRA